LIQLIIYAMQIKLHRMGFCRFSRWRYRSMIPFTSIDFITEISIDIDTDLSIDMDNFTIKLRWFRIFVCELFLQMYERRKKRRFDTGSTSTTLPPPPIRDQHPWPREREDVPIPLFDRFANPQTVAKSSECRNRAITNMWDDYYNIFYNEWMRVSIEPTGFIDPDVNRLLGIRSDL